MPKVNALELSIGCKKRCWKNIPHWKEFIFGEKFGRKRRTFVHNKGKGRLIKLEVKEVNPVKGICQIDKEIVRVRELKKYIRHLIKERWGN